MFISFFSCVQDEAVLQALRRLGHHGCSVGHKCAVASWCVGEDAGESATFANAVRAQGSREAD